VGAAQRPVLEFDLATISYLRALRDAQPVSTQIEGLVAGGVTAQEERADFCIAVKYYIKLAIQCDLDAVLGPRTWLFDQLVAISHVIPSPSPSVFPSQTALRPS